MGLGGGEGRRQGKGTKRTQQSVSKRGQKSLGRGFCPDLVAWMPRAHRSLKGSDNHSPSSPDTASAHREMRTYSQDDATSQ